MKALKIQKIICMYKNRKFALVKSHTQEELIEAIAELEWINSCDGCKWDYKIDNIDSQTGYRCDDISPEACYMCSRNLNDRYEKG